MQNKRKFASWRIDTKELSSKELLPRKDSQAFKTITIFTKSSLYTAERTLFKIMQIDRIKTKHLLATPFLIKEILDPSDFSEDSLAEKAFRYLFTN